jgi:hypothetical protein
MASRGETDVTTGVSPSPSPYANPQRAPGSQIDSVAFTHTTTSPSRAALVAPVVHSSALELCTTTSSHATPATAT